MWLPSHVVAVMGVSREESISALGWTNVRVARSTRSFSERDLEGVWAAPVAKWRRRTNGAGKSIRD